MRNNLPPIRRHDAGFTLIEILVVVALITALIGVVIAVGTQMRGSAKASQTRSLLGGLDGVSAEYKTRTSYPVFHRDNNKLYDWSGNKAKNAPGASGSGPITGSGKTADQKRANLYSERFVFLAFQVPTCREALERLGSASLTDKDKDGFLELRDAWGQCIAYASDVSHDDGVTEDDFLPEHKTPFFASPGEDQKWGQNNNKFVRDNLYSFDLARSSGTNSP